MPLQQRRPFLRLYDGGWKDKLLNWNGTAMTYDEVGNMLTKGGITFEWTEGRKLSGVNNGKKIRYFYDHTGARVKKVVDGAATEYRMAGDLLLSEKTGTQTCWYRYDSGSNLISVTIKGKIYFYVRNAQNDIIGLIDAEGNSIAAATSAGVSSYISTRPETGQRVMKSRVVGCVSTRDSKTGKTICVDKILPAYKY